LQFARTTARFAGTNGTNTTITTANVEYGLRVNRRQARLHIDDAPAATSGAIVTSTVVLRAAAFDFVIGRINRRALVCRISANAAQISAQVFARLSEQRIALRIRCARRAIARTASTRLARLRRQTIGIRRARETFRLRITTATAVRADSRRVGDIDRISNDEHRSAGTSAGRVISGRTSAMPVGDHAAGNVDRAGLVRIGRKQDDASAAATRAKCRIKAITTSFVATGRANLDFDISEDKKNFAEWRGQATKNI